MNGVKMAQAGNVKQLNQMLVLDAVYRRGSANRGEISEDTGLSGATVSRVVVGLTASGFLRCDGVQRSSQAGRKPENISFNFDYGCLCGLYIEQRWVSIARSNLAGEIVDRRRIPLPDQLDHPALIHLLVGEIRTLCGEHNLLGVSTATIGAVDMDEGRVITSIERPELSGIALKADLEGFLSAPVYVGNDVGLAAVGAYRRQRRLGGAISELVYAYFGNGVGAGIITGDKNMRQSVKFAGEISYFLTSDRALEPSSGECGTLEEQVGVSAVLSRATGMGLLNGADLIGDTQSALEKLARLADGGNLSARSLTEQAVRRITMSILNLCCVVAPQLVVLSGEWPRALGPRLVNYVRECLDARLPFSPQVQLAEQEDLEISGAIDMALERSLAQYGIRVFE